MFVTVHVNVDPSFSLFKMFNLDIVIKALSQTCIRDTVLDSIKSPTFYQFSYLL